ncbi:translation initiation factor IF-2-like [Onychostruthus taczanowskii]|uniref:translation initiation factor IF-2-like n=1 Tax=Onychostruthus taczanowskii TaxID=356909 RepID=UPI001B805BE9|nr:translation initiation factor IF-2-like [Onychostruthus taczanowskii]
MEAVARVVSYFNLHWGIRCDFKHFQLAINRLHELGTITRPIDIFNSEIWVRCTIALAKDLKATGSAKCLKAWAKAEEALKKASEQQEAWEAAKTMLIATPKIGSVAATQSAPGNSPEGGRGAREAGVPRPNPRADASPGRNHPAPQGDPPTPPQCPQDSPIPQPTLRDPSNPPRTAPDPSPPEERAKMAAHPPHRKPLTGEK